VLAQIAAYQQRADRKVLVATIFAGPCLDGSGTAHV
jgi:hypothetical protein